MTRRRGHRALAAVALAVLAIDTAQAAESIRDTYAEHTRAVELARAGKPEEALSILERLLARFPDDYPLQRDHIMITARTGDCDAAMARFARVRHAPQLDDYLVRELADCGVRRARAGDYAGGGGVLARLLADFPDDYRLRRDYIVVSSWEGECARVLAQFEHIREQPRLEDYLVRAVADCAVREARAGEHEAGIAVLEALRAHAPDPYVLERDIVVLRAWRGECPQALARFERIRDQLRYEPYLVVAVSDCQLDAGRRMEAAALVNDALERHPQDPALRFAWLKANVALRMDSRYDDERRAIDFDTGTDYDDGGLLEWSARLEASAPVAARTRLYARYLATRSDEPQYEAGNQHRAGLGVRYRFNPQWRIDQEFSTDLRNSGQGGSATEVIYDPRDTWQLVAGYTTFAEDVPLRARAAGVESDRIDLRAEYNSLDYVWRGMLAGSAYDFSDGNQRRSGYATVGYAFEMLPYREQRVFLEWSQVSNTLEDTVYFNPSRDRSLGLTHRTDFVHESRYERHVDTLLLSAAAASQAGYATKPEWSVTYEQHYDFDELTYLAWAAGVAQRYYDGGAQTEVNARLRFVRRF